MSPAFKTAAVVGKSDAANLPEVLEQLAGVLRGRGVAVVMDPATAGASNVKPDPATARSSRARGSWPSMASRWSA